MNPCHWVVVVVAVAVAVAVAMAAVVGREPQTPRFSFDHLQAGNRTLSPSNGFVGMPSVASTAAPRRGSSPKTSGGTATTKLGGASGHAGRTNLWRLATFGARPRKSP